jgi:tetratricopeptide (TPR) repeat protein
MVGSEDSFLRLYEELVTLSPRERSLRLLDLARSRHYPTALLSELGTYFSVAHERQDLLGLVGQVVSGYEVVDLLGQGGTGVVYRVQSANGEQLALKLLLPEGSEPMRQALMAEAERLQRISTPGVARLRAHGYWSDRPGFERPFVVTDLVIGLPIDTYAQRQCLPLEERVRLVAQVADVLAGIYLEHSLVHLDVKPHNVLIDVRDGRPRLIDFGLAQRAAEPAPAMATPAYAAPEQLEPERHGLPGSHSDQYALALVLYDLISGERGRRTPRRALRSLRPEVSPGLSAAIERALSEQVSRRYPDLASFASSLRYEAERLKRYRRMRRFTPWLAGSLVLAGLLGAATVATRASRAAAANLQGRSAQAAGRPLEAEQAFERAVALDPSLAHARYNSATAAETLGDLQTARRRFHAAIEGGGDPVPALNNLARLLIRGGQAEEALPLLRQAISTAEADRSFAAVERQRRLYRLYKNLGWAQLSLGHADAEISLRAAVRANEALREHDVLTLAKPGDADVAATCLLAELLTSSEQAAPEEREHLQRLCIDGDAHGEPEHEKWKGSASRALQGVKP